MESLTEEHWNALLSQPWLAKEDAVKSTAYLFKFYASTTEISCVFLVTDTKSVWTEVLNSNQFARRWRICNGLDASPSSTSSGSENTWRRNHLETLNKAYSLDGVVDLDFEITDSEYSDLAIEMECDVFKWRWETYFTGYKASAEIISKQLVSPLISVTHLALNSGDAVGKMSDADLEKAIDRMGQTARNALDTHIRTVISKPRVATSLQRMTAVVNKVPDLPAVCSTVESPSLQVRSVPSPQGATPEPVKSRAVSPGPMLIANREQVVPEVRMASPEQKTSIPAARSTEENSETEEDEEEVSLTVKGKAPASVASASPVSSPPPTSFSQDPAPKGSASSSVLASSDSDESPPAKKPKPNPPSSSDDDSDSDTVSKRSNAQRNDGVKRGTRQPIKRGGKRF
ncbi:hypothetical protein K435DRAFT_852092 [Dendrothele bispora CBS 962.96]|uniref:XLF-like N-terminal domain-containing protein n=1 Tax=Dendrothele bispora (strain CBS 962.96) TaxID=1314807 RepID=A0A4V6T5M3_DENBC|nr:hypothetical protein K435DRAFT_852092 [Dendrothele bispora CBS 962.96]